ncbi:MAG: holin [Acholeplasmatales bacterium]|nr:holin [Acholeplasmatales bacterium]
MILPEKVYEFLRWLIWIVLPAIGVLISTLDRAWGWGLPLDAILATLSGIELFLGGVLGIAKINNDLNEKK